MSNRTSLHWFPVFVADWLTSDAITLMLPEQEGAFFRLLLRAWGKGVDEPALPDDDKVLAVLSRLGKRWAKLGPLVKEQFEAREGRLFNAKLSEVWDAQQSSHRQAVERGKLGGRTRVANLKSGLSSSQDTLKQLEVELEVEEEKSSAPPPSRMRALPPSWTAEGVAWWLVNVGATTPAKFQKGLGVVVGLHSWEKLFPDLREWALSKVRDGRPAKPEWYAEVASGRLAPKPAMVDEFGVMTAYGERMTRPVSA